MEVGQSIDHFRLTIGQVTLEQKARWRDSAHPFMGVAVLLGLYHLLHLPRHFALSSQAQVLDIPSHAMHP